MLSLLLYIYIFYCVKRPDMPRHEWSLLFIIIIINCTFASQTQSYSRQLRLCHSTAYIIHCCYVTKTSNIIQLSSYKRLFKKIKKNKKIKKVLSITLINIAKCWKKSTSVKQRIMKMTRYFKSPFKKNKRLHKLINIAKQLHVFKSP